MGFLAALGLVGSGLFAVQVARGRSALPKWAAVITPGFFTVVVSLVGLASPNPEAFAALSANVAHVFFCGGLLVAARRVREDAA